MWFKYSSTCKVKERFSLWPLVYFPIIVVSSFVKLNLYDDRKTLILLVSFIWHTEMFSFVCSCTGPSHRGRGSLVSRGRGGGTPRGGQT